MEQPRAESGGRKSAWIALVVVAVVAAGLWRLEVEWHGWEGLTWIEYFHWAVPVGIAMFVGWVGVVGEFPTKARRWTGIIVAVILAAVMYVVTRDALVALFATGPSAMPYVLEYGADGMVWSRHAAVVWLVVIPVIVSSTGRLVGLSITIGEAAVSVLVFVGGYPAALLMIELLEVQVPADAIHAIKTGYVIPFQIIGLGIPFLPSGRGR